MHGGDEDLLDTEAFLERLEGHDQADGRAVGISDNVTAGQLARRLFFDQVKMFGVDLGNDEGHVGRHAEGAGVGKDGAACVGEFGLEFAGEGRVDGGEDDFGNGSGGCALGVGR